MRSRQREMMRPQHDQGGPATQGRSATRSEHAAGALSFHRFEDLAIDAGVQLRESTIPDTFGAVAFARGDEVHVRPGVLEATNYQSRHVVGHEIAHVMQQRDGRVRPDAGPFALDRSLEQEADAAGDRFARGEGLPQSAAPAAFTAAAPVQLYGGESDYVREVVQGGAARYSPATAGTYASDGPNDARMAPKSGTVSDAFNWAVTSGMDLLGFDTRRRPATEDNDFYRDYAKYMPGYNIDGLPSGAWAQNAATNHVGQGTGPGNPWDNIRKSLVSQEKGMIDADLAKGGSGQLSFWDVYGAHENAYDSSGGGGNGFVDPGSFALAVYGAPLLEKAGIDSGPITGASIDIFNNPEDSATEGWAKRMGLAGGEIGAGAGMAGLGMATMDPLMMAAGAGTAGLGAFGAAWNTGSAVSHGMLNEWSDAASGAIGSGISTAGKLWDQVPSISLPNIGLPSLGLPDNPWLL